MMMPAPVAALTTPLYKLATSAKPRCRLALTLFGGDAAAEAPCAAALGLLDLPAASNDEGRERRPGWSGRLAFLACVSTAVCCVHQRQGGGGGESTRMGREDTITDHHSLRRQHSRT